MAYDNTNKGTLGRNLEKDPENKPESANWPDYKGKVNVEGTEYWLSGWIKTAQQGPNSGQKFFSLSLTKNEKQQSPAPPPASSCRR